MLILSSTVHKWNLRIFFRTFLRIFMLQEIETHVSSQHKAGWVLPLRLIGESCVSQSDHFLWVRLPLRHWKHICGVWGLLSLRSQSRAPVCVYVRVGVRACVRSALDFSGWVLIRQAATGPLCSSDWGVGSVFVRRSMSLWSLSFKSCSPSLSLSTASLC